MFKSTNFRPMDRGSSVSLMEQNEDDRELSSYSDENDTTNLSKIYHYETSEDVDEEANEEKKKCCPELNRGLIVYKAFYFLFFGAIGALFPYLAVFYKQLWLSPHQVGILIGLRPFIQMCASPLWGVLADTYNVSKWILLMSIGAWLASNYSISLVKPSQYEPGCSLNLTYLPMIDDVDDQDFNWPNIEPVVLKKDNISKPGFGTEEEEIDRLRHFDDKQDGKPSFDNKDYDVPEEDLESSLEDEGVSSYRDGGRLQADEIKGYLNEKVKTAEVSIKSSLYEKQTTLDKQLLKMKPAKEKDSQLSINETLNKEIINKLSASRKINSSDKASKQKGVGRTIVKLLKIMFHRNRRQSHQSETNSKFYEKSSMKTNKNSNMKLKKVEPNRVLGHSNENETMLPKKKKSETGLLRDTDARMRRAVVDLNGDNDSPSNDDFVDEKSDEYMQDVLNTNEGGEYYSESILPNQRVLAKEGLREEFDSLRAAGEVFWPVLNRADPTNSSEIENGAQSVETTKIFNILLAITICGTILSSPAATLSDTATLQALGDDKYRYGQQRLWGAFGWGIGAFIVGAIVSVTQEINLCADPKHIDYVLSFYVYAVVMVLAFICAMFFRFDPVGDASYRESFWEAFTLFADCQHLCFILTLLCSGTAMGFTHTFLFWHLHDMGGSQFLFSIIAAVQCTSEVFMYFVSGYLILKIGCDSVLYIGILANVLRLFAYSVITQPFYSVPLEILQGISSASIWTAAVCYVGLNEGVQVTLQAILHGIYWGLGHGGGGMLGGVVVSSMGSNATFIIFGICCIVNLAMLLIMKYWKKLFEFLSGYTSVETIPSGTYILLESQRAGKG